LYRSSKATGHQKTKEKKSQSVAIEGESEPNGEFTFSSIEFLKRLARCTQSRHKRQSAGTIIFLRATCAGSSTHLAGSGYFDAPNCQWLERSPREVGYRQGFYDYASSEIGLQSADEAFGELERTFPRIRRDLLDSNFKDWIRHLNFLLRYAQIMRARSLLFFERQYAEWKGTKARVVEEVHPETNSIKVRSMNPEVLPDTFIRNRTITEMREEIGKGAAWLSEFQWALRFCDSPADPFVISEVPFICRGHHAKLADVLQDAETLLLFPFCWRACLIGSRQYFDVETDRFGSEDMRTIRTMYRESAKLFVISPTKLQF